MPTERPMGVAGVTLAWPWREGWGDAARLHFGVAVGVGGPPRARAGRNSPSGWLVLLELRTVSRSFGGLAAVKAVDLNVELGEIVGLIGPNGAGKTTLFNLITRTYRPNAGAVVFEGVNVTRMAPHARCRLGIARTFQLVRPFPNLTVLDNV